ncbi:hypothetical protein F5Y08DRAFT_347404 [Xylaria arbuscula]|nr:hypothetical protein F5Y08DRAFT_347404 [Xylaria arbuscula]
MPGYRMSRSYPVSNASSISAVRTKYEGLNRLEVIGLLFARVSSEGQLSDGRNLRSTIGLLETLGLDDLQTPIYPTGETLLDPYIRTIFTGRFREYFSGEYFPPLLEALEDTMRLEYHPEQAISPAEGILHEAYMPDGLPSSLRYAQILHGRDYKIDTPGGMKRSTFSAVNVQ